MRRYDIDWLRVIAIGLLLIYHVAIGFQPWGLMIGFMTNESPWLYLWIPMSMLNVWRIPFLFFVSGMGVYFAMQHRPWGQLLKERSTRILLPYVFGTIVIVPLGTYVVQLYYHWPLRYTMHPAHLWFLGNIFMYVVVLSPIFYFLKRNVTGKFVSMLRSLFSNPLGVLPVTLLFILEVAMLKPVPFELYAFTWHGVALGAVAFFCGFCFVLAGDPFWKMLTRWRWMFVTLAAVLYILRIFFPTKLPGAMDPVYLLVIESNAWIFSVFAFGYLYLNRPGRILQYLSEAAYPVYIVHMLFLNLASCLIFPLSMKVELKFFCVLAITLVGSLATFELVRKLNFLRILFGLKLKTTPSFHAEDVN